MKVERTLQILLAVLSVLGTLLLGLGENDSLVVLLMLAAAPTAVIFTDILGWLRLNRPLANAAALAAVGYTMIDFFRHGGQNQLLAIANLLLYLQLVLLFQEKNLRVYWQLLVLSLLEVVVAAAMSLSVQFGFLLLLYMVLALAALLLQFVLRESRRWSAQAEQVAAEMVQTRVGRPVALLAVMTLVFAAAIFYATPRIGGTTWSGAGGGRAGRVGFSRSVTLEEMGRILESDELAMRVSFIDNKTQLPYEVVGQTYFRGAVLNRYAVQAPGRWSPGTVRDAVPIAGPPTGVGNLIDQEIRLEPTQTSTLFSISPAYRLPDTPQDVLYDARTAELQRAEAGPLAARGRLQYRVTTTGLYSGRAIPVIPDAYGTSVLKRQEYFSEVRDCEAFDRRKFPQIAALAERILREADALDADRLRKARLLEAHFLQSGQYTYSLDFRFPRVQGVDPIEDFVARHRTGHCEYFATALVLMLRSQKIPARLVVGYKGGEFNGVGDYLLVRQRDAHAWVEMHIDPEEVELLNVGGWQYPGSGGWWRLDPTPGLREEGVDVGTWRTRWDQMLDYAEFLWNDYVQSMGPERQRESVYDPLAKPWGSALGAWLDPRLWPRRFAELRGWAAAEWRNRPWSLGIGGTIGLLVALWAARRWGRRLLAALVDGWRRVRDRGFRRRKQAGSSIAFYASFEMLLAERGLLRPSGVTPREWLEELARPASWQPWAMPQGMAPATSLSGCSDRPEIVEQFLAAARGIIERFYLARYCAQTLGPADLAQIEASLALIRRIPPP